MKTEREFLNGIYEKAAVLATQRETEQETVKRKSFFAMPAFKMVAVAAAFVIVATPAIYLFNGGNNKMEIPEGYSLVERKVDDLGAQRSVTGVPQTGIILQSDGVPMMASANAPIEAAELVCLAEVSKIEKSVYDKEQNVFTTTVSIKATDIYKDATANDVVVGEKLSVKVNGGFDVKTKSYQEYEAVFSKGEKVLLLALPTYEDESTYILSGGGEGKFVEVEQKEQSEDTLYVNSVGAEIRLSELVEYSKNSQQ